MATCVRSHAKVNLGLAIAPTRPDGFHGLLTLYQTLDLHDLVTVTARPSPATSITLTSNNPRVPTDSRNTAWRMVEGALTRMATPAEVAIHIDKRLPIQGGMGAGSANAAAALIALEKEFSATLPAADRLALAAEVGSDVPLFLIGGAVLGENRGETVSPVPDFEPTACVVALPSLGVSTPLAFREWDARLAASLTSGGKPDTLSELSRAYASILLQPRVESAAREGKGTEPGASGIARTPAQISIETPAGPNDLAENTLLALVHTGIENDFEEVVFSLYPSLREIKRSLMGIESEAPALYAALSGSGSALFGLYRSTADARSAQQRVQASGTRALVTETLPRAEYWRRMFAE